MGKLIDSHQRVLEFREDPLEELRDRLNHVRAEYEAHTYRFDKKELDEIFTEIKGLGLMTTQQEGRFSGGWQRDYSRDGDTDSKMWEVFIGSFEYFSELLTRILSGAAKDGPEAAHQAQEEMHNDIQVTLERMREMGKGSTFDITQKKRRRA